MNESAELFCIGGPVLLVMTTLIAIAINYFTSGRSKEV